MRLGVVTTCHAHAKFLPESLASIVLQTVAPAFHVVVSDGDPEAAELMDDYVAGKPSHRLHVPRSHAGGPAVAWNTAIRMLPDEIDWCMKHDADDVAHPEWVQDVSAAVAADPTLDLVVPPCRHIGIGFPDGPSPPWRFPEYSRERHLREGCTPAQTAFRRALFDHVGGFDETMPSSEDWDFFVRAGTVLDLRVVQLAEPRWYYRHHDGHRAHLESMRQARAYRAYFAGHTPETVMARSRSWARYCDSLPPQLGDALRHGGAPWLQPRVSV